jgi:hypothetical protein
MAPPKRGCSWLLSAAGLDDGIAGADQGCGHGDQGDAEVIADSCDPGGDRRVEGDGHECELEVPAHYPSWDVSKGRIMRPLMSLFADCGRVVFKWGGMAEKVGKGI